MPRINVSDSLIPESSSTGFKIEALFSSGVLKGSQLNLITGPMVYIWRRELEVLYIGCSMYGFGRFSNHHVMNGQIEVLSDDTIEILFMINKHEARKLEYKLIKELKPKYNTSTSSTRYVDYKPLTRKEMENKKLHQEAINEIMKGMNNE